MGIADVIPGVSGGTIAFITGIYPRLIEALSSIDLSFLTLLLQGKFKESINTIKKIDFPFLIPLVSGIFVAILVFSKVMTVLLENFPAPTFAFFGGLIIASAFVMYKQGGKLKFEKLILAILGFLIAYILAGSSSIFIQSTLPFIFFSGVIAITAMILPGISGSFILLLLGQYQYILNALHTYNFVVIITFAFGALTGLITFSKLLNYIIEHFRNLAISFLIGLMVGSLRLPINIVARGEFNLIVPISGVIGLIIVYGMNKIHKE